MTKQNMTQFLRKELQEKLEDGKISSLAVQVISLIHFAESIGYKPVDNNIRKGFVGYDHKTWNTTNHISLSDMQQKYNIAPNIFIPTNEPGERKSKKIVNRISIQYHKRTTKQLSSELHWLKFVKES